MQMGQRVIPQGRFLVCITDPGLCRDTTPFKTVTMPMYVGERGVGGDGGPLCQGDTPVLWCGGGEGPGPTSSGQPLPSHSIAVPLAGL